MREPFPWRSFVGRTFLSKYCNNTTTLFLTLSFSIPYILLHRSPELVQVVQKYCIASLILFLFLFWCPYMVINVSVQYDDELLPDIIPLTLCDYIGEPF